MSDKLIPTTSSSAAEMQTSAEAPAPASERKFMNLATQHGNESNADEENIVVLALSFSPKRETDDDVVWHEELEEYDADVSTNKRY
jgi:hypothetical protein